MLTLVAMLGAAGLALVKQAALGVPAAIVLAVVVLDPRFPKHSKQN